MDKSSVISFRRVNWTGLMVVVLFAAGCTSKPVQPAVVATTTPEATATATIEPNPTLEPTPTIAPKPDYINDDNSVQTDDGTVFVKDGKYMLYDPKTGEIREIRDISTEVTFNTTSDASRVVLAMHTAEYENQDELYKQLSPNGILSDFTYKMQLDKVTAAGNMDEGSRIGFGAKVAEYVKIKSPIDSIDFPEVVVAMLMQYGNKRPVPYAIGINNQEGGFTSFYNTASLRSASDATPIERIDNVQKMNLNQIRPLIAENIIQVSPLFARNPTNTTVYTEPADQFKPDGISSQVLAERRRLLNFNLTGQARLGYEYLKSGEAANQTGAVYSALEQMSVSEGVEDIFFLGVNSTLFVIRTP
jgi:hypothetical protein